MFIPSEHHTQKRQALFTDSLALHIDRLHRRTARDTEGEVQGKGREAGVAGGEGEEKHTVVHSLNQSYWMDSKENKKY